MKSLLLALSLWVAAEALPSERWPNVIGPKKHQVVVITPTSEYAPPDYSHGIAPKKDAIYHSSYAAIEQHYPTPQHHPPPPKKNPRYDEKVIRKYYNNLVDKQVAFKKNFIQKAVDKTVDVTAKLTQYTVDFLSRIAIDTAAKLAKTGAKNVIHKKEEKINSANHYHH